MSPKILPFAYESTICALVYFGAFLLRLNFSGINLALMLEDFSLILNGTYLKCYYSTILMSLA
jgi:hypothetical protein